jgi:hypothetical protein
MEQNGNPTNRLGGKLASGTTVSMFFPSETHCCGILPSDWSQHVAVRPRCMRQQRNGGGRHPIGAHSELSYTWWEWRRTLNSLKTQRTQGCAGERRGNAMPSKVAHHDRQTRRRIGAVLCAPLRTPVSSAFNAVHGTQRPYRELACPIRVARAAGRPRDVRGL